MNQHVTTGIILQRTDYGEADRILVLLTPDRGKLHLMAKGVRKLKSKLAGGIELFSVSQITYLTGRSDLGTLLSARLDTHYGNIVRDINRTMLGYELIKQLNRVTEDEPEAEYFELLRQGFAALDDAAVDLELIRTWFTAQLLRLGGHSPNLQTDSQGLRLNAGQRYGFDIAAMAFAADATQVRETAEYGYDYQFAGQNQEGRFTADHIKFMRLLFAGQPPQRLQQVSGSHQLVAAVTSLVASMAQISLRH
jgi:recombinational DNA repair protein (RecF pathway)